jgi:hypothetical protein
MKVRMKEAMKAFVKKMSFDRKTAVRAALPVIALALIASVGIGRERRSDVPSEPAARIDTRIAPREPSTDDIDIARIQRSHEPVEASKVDPFRQHSFAAPAQGAGGAPAPRSAPPLPFRYVGKMIEDGKLSVFVMRGDDSFSLHKGQRIDDYRVDKVSESEVVFTYLPLKTRQELNLSAVN